MDSPLQFRRQFILTKAPIDLFPGWECIKIDQYYLYAHPDLVINQIADSMRCIVLIGDLYDSEAPEKGNCEILQDILIGAYSIEHLFSSIKRYVGCYVLLYKSDKETIILSDALALREIFYFIHDNQIICGSQPNLISKFSKPKIRPTNNHDILDFYKNYLWDSRWISEETYFEGVKHLLPNHYLDINKRKACRYWPAEPIKELDLKEAVSKSCLFLQGVMIAIVNRHSCMMAVTSGTDSRILLSASKSILSRIYCFINNHGLGYKHPDISVPKNIFKSIGYPFHIEEVPDDVDEEFRQIFFGNTFLASDRLLPSIYNVFYKKHSEKVLILGISEIGRAFYGKEPKNLNSYNLAYKLGYKKCRYVIRLCDQILSELMPVARKYEINFLDLFYWEQRLGNWGGVRNSESAIAIEKIDPFNSHMLYEIFLGVDEKYRNYRENTYIYFNEIIRNMWPELLKWPINPPYTIREKIVWFLEKQHIFEALKELKYQMNYFWYMLYEKGKLNRDRDLG